jgi:hypothetical protein
MPSRRLPRRTLLRGLGTAAIALPFFEEMSPRRANSDATHHLVLRSWHPA